jgi:hypothetical protein
VSKIVIGHVIKSDGSLGHAVDIDLQDLTEYRLLVQGGSGSGKTHTLYRIVEQFYGKIQIIILDREGDFVALRERFPDFVIAGKGRDIPADPASAELLALKTLEHEFPLIVDQFEMRDHERQEFSKNFLNAMINAPERLWHPCLVLIDEVDETAPEKSAGVSLSTQATAGFAKRGRKRGYAILIGTQRISDVSKSVISQCRNKIIGFADLDIDLKRSARAIGLRGEEGETEVENLQRGEFFVRGPAFGRSLLKVKVGPIKTDLQRTTSKGRPKPAPPPSGKLKKLLSDELTDLAKQSKEDLRDKESMREKIKELERELRAKEKAEPKAPPPAKLDEKALKKMADRARAEFAGELAAMVGSRLGILRKALSEDMKSIAKNIGDCLEAVDIEMRAMVRRAKEKAELLVTVPPVQDGTAASRVITTAPRPVAAPAVEIDGRKFGKCERAMLQFLAARKDHSFSKVQLGLMTLYSPNSSSFHNALSNLSAAGLIVRHGDRIQVNPDADGKVKEIIGDTMPASWPTPADWLTKLGKCESALLTPLLNEPSRSFERHELAMCAGYSVTSSSFHNGLSKLSSLGLLTRNPSGTVSLNQEVAGL